MATVLPWIFSILPFYALISTSCELASPVRHFTNTLVSDAPDASDAVFHRTRGISYPSPIAVNNLTTSSSQLPQILR